MKKRFLVSLLFCLCTIFCAIGFAACNGDIEKQEEPIHTHIYIDSTVNPTCTKKGYTLHKCSCGDEYIDNYVNATGHAYSEQVIKPTCTEKGYTKHTCSCGDEYIDNYVNATGHAYSEQVIKPTCTEKGYTKHTCSCGDEYIDNYVNAKGHRYSEQVIQPTCTEQGYTVHTCSCGDEYIDNYVNAKGHSYSTEWTTDDTYHWHVATCEHTTEIKDKANHTASDWIIDEKATYEKKGSKHKECTVCKKVLVTEEMPQLIKDGISFKTLMVDENLNIYVKVPNNQTVFNFINEVKVSGNAIFVVSTDIYGMQQIPTKTVPLKIGDNTFYIIETVGNDIRLFTVTVRRRPIYTVTFNTNGGTTVASQKIEEDSFATEPTTMRTGYTFVSWDCDFSKPITKERTITASWNANTNTKYKVEYYLQNLEDDNYTIDNTLTENLSGTTDTTAKAEIKAIEHFTALFQSVSGTIKADGSLVLKVYYTRNKFFVNLSLNNENAGNVQNRGSYKYDELITVEAITNIGYTFSGWYVEQNLVSKNEQITFKVCENVEIEARFEMKDEMCIFEFVSTPTTCKITKIKDKSITEVAIVDCATSIGDHAFDGCSSLQGIIIPNSVTSIGDYAFYNCTQLQNITIPESVTSIGSSAFSGCSSLIEMTIPFVGDKSGVSEDTAKYTFGYIFGTARYDGGIKTTQSYKSGPYIITINYYIPKTLRKVTVLGEYIQYEAFNDCVNLQEIVIGEKVTSIGSSAFNGCTSLTSIIMPDSVISIGNYAFSGCTSLTSIIIPDSVISIGNYAFKNCYKLVEVWNKSSLKITKGSSSNGEVGYYALNIYTDDTLTKQWTDENGYIFYEDGDTCCLIGYTGNDIELTLPSSCHGKNYAINQYAFYNCTSLTSIEISSSVTSIGYHAFYKCTSLTSVTIGNSVTSIVGEAFDGCYKLVEVWNKSSLKITKGSSSNGEVGYYALNIYTDDTPTKQWTDENGYIFYEDGDTCYLIGYTGNDSELTLPSSCHGKNYAIYKFAFENCMSLTSIEIPNSVTSIGYDAFENCTSLTSIIISDSVTSIGDCAFWGCTQLQSITIPESVTSIGSSAFSGCSSLTSITIPDSVVSIEYNAFGGCSSLTSITIPNSVTSIGDYAFNRCSSLESITFSDTSTWYMTTNSRNWQEKSYGTSVDVSSPNTNATYFTTHSGLYWYKK